MYLRVGSAPGEGCSRTENAPRVVHTRAARRRRSGQRTRGSTRGPCTGGRLAGELPARLALEQEDAIRIAADRCGYSSAAAQRAFRARFWSMPRRAWARSHDRARHPEVPEHESVGIGLISELSHPRAAVALGLRDGAGLPPACPSVFFCLLIQPGFRRSVGSVRRWVNSIGRSIRPFGGNSPTVIAYAVSGRAGDRRGRGYWGRDPVLTLRAARSVAVCLLASGRAAASLPWRCVGNRPIRPEAKAACHSPARALRRVAPLPPGGKGGSCESFPREY
jgi:hypothetical protein